MPNSIDISSLFEDTSNSDLTTSKAIIIYGFYYVIHILFAILSMIVFAPIAIGYFHSVKTDSLSALLKTFSNFIGTGVSTILLITLSKRFFKISLNGNRYVDAAWNVGNFKGIIVGILSGIFTYSVFHLLSSLFYDQKTEVLSHYFNLQVQIIVQFGVLITTFLNLGCFAIASISEELLCRGIIFGAFSNKFSKMIGIFVSTLFFTLLHFPIESSSALFTYIIISIISISLRLFFKSISPSIFFHLFYNFSLLFFFIFEFV